MRTESDAFRYYTSEGLDALDSTTKAFGLVNRFIDMQDSVPAMGDTDTNAAFKNRVPAGRARRHGHRSPRGGGKLHQQ